MIKLGIIGLGYWGNNIYKTALQMPEIKIDAISDIKLDHYKNYKEILNLPLDAIIVATPIETHYQITLDSLNAKKHTLVEKPIATNKLEAQKLNKIAKKNNLVLMVDHTPLYSPAIQEIKNILNAEKLCTITTTRAHPGKWGKNWNIIWELAPHDIAILDYLVGKTPLKVSATGYSHLINDFEDGAHLLLDYGEEIVHANVNLLNPIKIRTTTITTKNKTIIFDDMQPKNKLKIYPRNINITPNEIICNNQKPITPKLSEEQPLHITLKHFFNCINENKKPITNGNSAIRVVKILTKLYESVKRKGEWKKI